jgi:aromatic ring-cleaving dioxygenase
MSEISGWHAHIYFDPATTQTLAETLKAEIAATFPDALLGRTHASPVGPHTAAMFQVAFAPALFATLVPWLALQRRGLAVLIHPETGRQRADHLDHALWLGAILPLKAEMLPE